MNTIASKKFNPHGGVGYHHLEFFSLSPQNQKDSELRHLGNLKYILCSHFNEKNRVGGKVSCRRWRVGRGLLPPDKIKSFHFDKFVDCMVLQLTVNIRRSFPSLLSQKPSKFWYLELNWNFHFGLHFTENRLFWALPWIWRHCDVLLEMLVLILVCM